ILRPMVQEGKDPVFSMGDDIPPAVLSARPRLLYQYFKQRFAQVTNPPIDPLRERTVMSLAVYLGPRPSFLEDSPAHAHLLQLPSPILLPDDMRWLQSERPIPVRVLPARFPVDAGRSHRPQPTPALGRVPQRGRCGAAEDHVQDGNQHALGVLRRSALRGSGARPHTGDAVLPRHALTARWDRPRRACGGGAGPSPRGTFHAARSAD